MKVDRYYLEIKSLKDLNEVDHPNEKLILERVNPPDIEINKFFYKNIGKKYRWVDRLAWDNLKWMNYLENKNVQTYVLKSDKDLIGYFEAIKELSNHNSEIAYFGILEDYMGKKYGGYLLTNAIKKLFELDCNRVWVHTCSLDHKNALQNYLDRGMKIFKEDTIEIT